MNIEKWTAFLLDKQKRPVMLASGAILLCLFLLLAVYLPLGSRLKKSGMEISRLEGELLSARETVSFAKRLGKEVFLPLPKQQEVSFVMDEITELGNELGVNFRSIRPKEIEKTSSTYQVLPIEMRLEAPYRELGTLMGALKNLKGGLVTIEDFEMVREEETLPDLKADLLVKLVLAP